MDKQQGRQQWFRRKSVLRDSIVGALTIKDGVISRLHTSKRRADNGSDGDLYLSPHADDVCFSLGSLVNHRRAGILLTIFSQSDHLLQQTSWRTNAFQTMDARQKIETASRIRRMEDLAFADRVGLKAAFAGLDEARLRNRDPFDSAKSVEDAVWLERQLIDAIAAAGNAPAASRPVLYCPMGIGGHVDHLVTLRIVRKRYEELHSRYEIAFYEDLHYAANWENRVSGVSRFRDIIYPLKPRRWMFPVENGEYKLDLIRIYRSQFRDVPDNIVDFIPATKIFSRPHEAVWTLGDV